MNFGVVEMEFADWSADAALDLAKVIAEKSPVAVLSTKHLMNRECPSL